MLKRSWTFSLLSLNLLLLSGCGGDSVAPSDLSSSDHVPLDGRGGGILAYTYYPSAGDVLRDNIEIRFMNADGSGDRKVVDTAVPLSQPDWSPDSQKLATSGQIFETGTRSIYTFGADGLAFKRLTDTEGVWDQAPAWSPDGSTIAFSRSYPSEGYRSELWLINTGGSGEQDLGLAGYGARWSPDGTRLAYQSLNSYASGGESDIMTCAADGTDVRALVNAEGDEYAPAWSPDGSRVAFVADYDGDFDVYLVNADGTNLQKLTNNTASDQAPRWSSDGSRITFYSEVAGELRWQVFVMDADGSNLTQVSQTPQQATARDPAWRPDPL